MNTPSDRICYTEETVLGENVNRISDFCPPRKIQLDIPSGCPLIATDMKRHSDKLANLLEYIGITSKSYYHTLAKIAYHPDNAMPYYLDQTRRADYPGPYDDNGLPLYVGKGKTTHLPVHIAFWALGHLQAYLNSNDISHRKCFLAAADWLVSSQNDHGIWPTPFPMKRFGLDSGFPSAMSQGLAISCLIRAFSMTEDRRFWDSAENALKPFHVEIRGGGVASYDDGRTWFEEYPAYPFKHVFNGFIYALWGLYDLVRFADHAEARTLYDSGVQTLKVWLPRFDLGYWSRYHIPDCPKNPATIHYHRLHIDQLEIMHRLTDENIFREYRDRWNGYLQRRFNTLRTLPAKIRWQLYTD
ncbi:MAG: hypothetical protein JW763_08035 [candidate division Zixibacteria bacterium]|nr:hypothetical protein [candidate division Zixibacteria bacterium]